MATKNPEQVASKWARNLGRSTEDIRDGVNAVTENPAAKAIAKKDKMVQNWNIAMNDGKWDRAMQKVTLQDWKTAMLEKGINRIASGATASQSKMADFMRDFLPYVESAQSEIDGMPDLTLEDSIARSAAWIRKIADYKR